MPKPKTGDFFQYPSSMTRIAVIDKRASYDHYHYRLWCASVVFGESPVIVTGKTILAVKRYDNTYRYDLLIDGRLYVNTMIDNWDCKYLEILI